jgi:hypothetical protein
MNYVILEKAKPYTRVRRGKLERVKGYASRIRLAKNLEKSFNLNKVYSEKDINERTLLALRKELNQMKKKIVVDGHNDLSLHVKENMGGAITGVFQEVVRKGRWGGEITVEKGRESLAHEWGHYMFARMFQKMGGHGEFKPELSDDFDVDILTNPLWKGKTAKKMIKEEFRKFKNSVPTDLRFEVYELNKLWDYLGEFYSSNYKSFVNENAADVTYLMDPSEIFARVVENYVGKERYWGLEEHSEYTSIVKRFGDKYFKTGIIKALEG